MLTNLGEAMERSGLREPAAGQFEKALDLAEEAGSPDAPRLRGRLAQLRRQVVPAPRRPHSDPRAPPLSSCRRSGLIDDTTIQSAQPPKGVRIAVG